jgi:hypothetical protein
MSTKEWHTDFDPALVAYLARLPEGEREQRARVIEGQRTHFIAVFAKAAKLRVSAERAACRPCITYDGRLWLISRFDASSDIFARKSGRIQIRPPGGASIKSVPASDVFAVIYSPFGSK